MIASLIEGREAGERRLRQLQHLLEPLLRHRYGLRREGIARFIHGWLSRAQDRNRNSAGANGKSYVPDTIGESPPAAGPMDPEYEKLVNEKADALFGGLEL